ncbi:helix-turn-helix domain-containing protein [Streptomyces sp. NPDC059874]|uniref:helix-turn-helix domain-containing protein n=1 Tax=Streptomyces sp. NPDC059874 TaxID=3346983 RepID=UPI003654D736
MTQSVETTSASDAERSLPSPKERRRLREAADLTHDEVAAAVGVTPTTVRSWETGRTAPRGRKLELYARFLTRLQAPAEPTAARANVPAGLEADEPATTPEATPAGSEAVAPTEAAPRPAARAGAADTDSAARTPAPVEQTPAGSPDPAGATGSARAFAGAEPVRGTAAGTRPKAATKATAGAVRHDAKPPTPVSAGEHPGSPGPTREPYGTTEPDQATAPSPGTAERSLREAPAAAEAPGSTAEAPQADAATASAAAGRTTTAQPDQRPEPAEAPGSAGTTGATTEETPRAEPTAEPDQATPQAKRLPVEDFDALHAHAASALTRQTYLLTGRRALALEAVERAFQQAWERWPEVATDPDPVGWVRAAAYEYALSPWHQFRRAHRHPDKPPAEPADRILLDAMLALPTNHRRTVLLYDGVGLDLPDTAAETEASTPTAGNRLLHAHATLAARIPELADVAPEKQSALLRDKFTALHPAVALEPRPAAVVREAGERRTRLWTRTVIGLTAVIAVATAYTAATAPTKYDPPNAPGANVSGVPPHSGPQRLTEESRALHDKLRSDPAAGPARIVPKVE